MELFRLEWKGHVDTGDINKGIYYPPEKLKVPCVIYDDREMNATSRIGELLAGNPLTHDCKTRHPMPYCDGIDLSSYEDYRFFFKDPCDLIEWFQDLTEHPQYHEFLQISEFIGNDVIVGGRQCICLPENTTKIKTWSIEEWIKAYY